MHAGPVGPCSSRQGLGYSGELTSAGLKHSSKKEWLEKVPQVATDKRLHMAWRPKETDLEGGGGGGGGGERECGGAGPSEASGGSAALAGHALGSRRRWRVLAPRR